jgi:gluconokinase
MTSAKSPIIVVMGVSGSGKSSLGQALAQRLSGHFIEGDDLHPASNIEKMSAGIPLDDADRMPWLDGICIEINSRRSDGAPIVASCSALKKAYRDRLRSKVSDRDLQFIFLDGSLDVLFGRMQARKDHFMPSLLLSTQIATLEPPIGEPDVLWVDVAASLEQSAQLALDHLATISLAERP